ncbi:MAG: lysine--tRNA ligase, partial [Desulfocucumaceae bacterium]
MSDTKHGKVTITRVADHPEDINEMMQVRREKLADLREKGADPFGGKYIRSNMAREVSSDFEGYEGREVSVAGRIMARRIMGKASF